MKEKSKSSIGRKEIRNVEGLKTIDEKDKKMTIEGYAIVFDKPATHTFTEVIARGALDDCDLNDVCLKYNHSDEYVVMARTRNQSLKLEVDDIGLKITADLIDTQSNRDIYNSIQAGLLDKMSFAFTVDKEEWNADGTERTIYGIDKLFDVSVVTEPFYDDTSVYARSKEIYRKKQLDLQKKKLNMILEII